MGTMKEIVLRVEGMHCGSCIRRVTQSLQSISGAVVEDVRLGAARVRLEEGSAVEPLIAVLGKAGFSARQEA